MLDIVPTTYGFEVKFDYKPWLKDAIKKIPGAGFRSRGGDKFWFVPSSSEVALLNWAKGLGSIPKEVALNEIGEIEPLPELMIDIPLKMPMFPYQKNGVAYSLLKERLIVGDQPGLGKTVQSIAFAEGVGCKCILVICPATLRENWKREIEDKWTYKKALVLSDRVKNTWVQFYKVGMVKYFICNYESLKKYFVESINIPEKDGKKVPMRLNHITFKDTINLFDCVIIDEVHRCKDGKTQQSKFVMGICKGKKYVLALTGTPVVNKPIDLIPQLHIIGQLQAFGGYNGFINRYCQGYNQASNLKELNYLLHKNCFYRREKTEVLKDLPDKMRNILKCDIETRAEYKKAEDDLKTYLKENLNKSDAEISKSLRGEVMVMIQILKKIAARGKISEVIAHIQEVVEAGEKIVVFAWHKEIVYQLKDAIPGAVTIVGDDSMEQRQHSVDGFQNNPNVQVIICNIKSGGVGITLTASSRVAFIELPWHPADAEQCEDRCIVEGEPVLTPDGWKPIETIKIGDTVINGEGGFAKVTDAWSKGNTKLVTELHTEGWGELKTTNNHQYLTENNEWIEASKLMPGDRIKMPYNISDVIELIQIPFDEDCRLPEKFIGSKGQTIPNGRLITAPDLVHITDEALFVFGYFAGDGFASIKKGKGRFISIAGNGTSKRASLDRCCDWFDTIGISHYERLDPNSKGIEIRAYSGEWAFFFKKHFGNDSHTKKLPYFLLKLNLRQSRILLEGLMASDGYYRKERYEYVTASNSLCAQVSLIILRSGFRPTISKNTTGQHIVAYSISQNHRYSLVQKVSTYFPKKVGGIRPKVYDLTTDSTESFVIGLSVVHNCHRIGQKDSVQCSYFLGANTIDEYIYDIIEKKRAIVNQVTGAHGEIETVEKNMVDQLIGIFSEQ